MKTNFRASIMLGVAMLFTPCLLQAETILFEDFEDSTLTYTSNLADALDDIGTSDYYGRLAPDTAPPPGTVVYSNIQGNGFYSAMDTDSAIGGGGPTPDDDLVQLDWSVDASNYENLMLSWFIAEDAASDGNQDWDSLSSFQIAVQLDGGGYNTIFQVESEENPGTPGDFTNETPRVDTNFDGIGDGAAITDAFTQYGVALADAGTVDIRVSIFELNAGDEDVAFDSLHLEGDLVPVVVPEPSSAALVIAAFMSTMVRRRRS